ncbi:MAG: MFS transporter, partial [Pseudonocardia sp.]|nr:MFS transporter [Pseudonocardia sp.]
GLAELPAGVSPAAAEAARDTLGGAIGAAQTLPAGPAAELVTQAQEAFVAGLQLTSLVAAGIAAAIAVLAAVSLREPTPEPDPEPAVCPA